MIREKIARASQGAAEGVAQSADAGARSRHRVPRSRRRCNRARQPGRVEDALRAFCARAPAAPPLADGWVGSALPAHLSMNVRVVDAAGKELAAGRDLGALARPARRGGAADRFPQAGPEFERSGIRAWDFGDLPESLAIERDGRQVTGYPGAGRQRRERVAEAATIRALPPMRRRASRCAAPVAAAIQGRACARWEKPPAGLRSDRAVASSRP